MNSRLRASNLGSAPPNALLDERDRLIAELSEKVLISVEYGSRYEAQVAFGRFAKGPVLVDGERAVPLRAIHSDTAGSTFQLGNGIVFKSVDDGAIKGLSSSLNVIESTVEKLDLLAIRLVKELNSLHKSGIDYDGEPGKELFTAKQFQIDLSKTNSKNLDITLLQVPGKVDAMSEMNFVYSASTDHWTASDVSGKVVGKGRKEIDLGGMVVKINTPARDGDKFMVSRVRGEAGRVEFLLNDGKEIAAASNFVITPASTNTGSAVLTSQVIEESPPDLGIVFWMSQLIPSLQSHSPNLDLEVLLDISRQIQGSFDLASFGQSATIEFNFLPTEGVKRFSVVLMGDLYDFPHDDTRSTLFPLADDKVTILILKSDLIAEYLNGGNIKSSSGHTLKDLGLFASGFEGGLKIAGGTSFTSGTLTTQDGATTSAIVRDSTQSSGFRSLRERGVKLRDSP